MSADKKPQTMKPATAAKKLGIYLPAARRFGDHDITRTELADCSPNRRRGWPSCVARDRTRATSWRTSSASRSGLARGGITEALTTAEIKDLLAAPRSGS